MGLTKRASNQYLASNTKRTHLAEEAADQVVGVDLAAEGDVDLSFL